MLISQNVCAFIRDKHDPGNAEWTFPAKRKFTLVMVKKNRKDRIVQNISLLPPVRAKCAPKISSSTMIQQNEKINRFFYPANFLLKSSSRGRNIELFDASVI